MMSVFNLFEAIFTEARQTETAILFEDGAISYADLRGLTIGVAEVLNALAVRPGERVAILLHDSPEFVSAFVAVVASGAIAVPVNLGLRPEEQRFILNDCGARIAIVESDISRELFAVPRAGAAALTNVLVVDRGREFDLRLVTGRAGTVPSGFKVLFLDEAPGKRLSKFPVRTAQADPAFVLYTSGSTGEPKGAVHRQADIGYTVDTYCKQVLRLEPGDRLFSSSKLPFAYGLGNGFTFPLCCGVTTILSMQKPLPEVVSHIFAKCQPTIFFGVPVVFNLLLKYYRDGGRLNYSKLRLCVSAGEALPPQICRDWQDTFGVEVLDGIGSTEMLHMFMSNRQGDVRPGSSGRVVPGYDAQLLNQSGEPVPAGEVGNLWVAGASAALEYWQRPDSTKHTFVDGWVRTGDLYRQDADGYYYHMGRSDDCFKASGQWVSPVEVEAVLSDHPEVNQVAVVEGFDVQGLPCVCAYVVAHGIVADQLAFESELRLLADKGLPRHKRPRKYVMMTELPCTATGKIQRFKLRERG